MAQSLEGKIAIVTGSGQGIGRAIASLLAAEGASVVTNSRASVNEDVSSTAADVAEEIRQHGGRALHIFADVGEMSGGKALVDAAVAEFGGLDIIVNNAGASTSRLLADISEDHWDAEQAVNLKAPFALAYHGAPHLIARGGGRIINFLSRVGIWGAAGMIPYAAAKAGVIGLTFALAKELEGSGITVNCVSPTANTPRGIRTAQTRYANMGQSFAPSERRTPDHIAPLVAYLVGPNASRINGQIFYVSAGEITQYSGPVPTRSIFKDGKWDLEELNAVMPQAFGAELKPPAAISPPV